MGGKKKKAEKKAAFFSLFFEAKGVFLNSQMKRPTKSNCETVVVGCSDFNQTPFNPPDLTKSAHIKTAQL